MIKVVFRCDANSTLGFGHLNRCLVLARALRKRGVICLMFGPEKTGFMSEYFDDFSVWVESEWQNQKQEAEKLIHFCWQQEADFLIIDDYRAARVFQEALVNSKTSWLQFFPPTPDAVLSNIAVCTNPAVNAAQFAKSVMRKETKCLLGLKFATLRNEFQSLAKIPNSNAKPTVLIMFGGGDDRGAIKKSLEATALIKRQMPLDIVVVSGESNPRNLTNQAIAAISGNGIKYLIQPSDLKQLYQSANFAIMAAGTSSYEAIACKLPMLLVSIADNQIQQAVTMQELGVAKYLGCLDDLDVDTISAAAMQLIKGNNVLKQMQIACESVIDGQGAIRLADAILKEITQ